MRPIQPPTTGQSGLWLACLGLAFIASLLGSWWLIQAPHRDRIAPAPAAAPTMAVAPPAPIAEMRQDTTIAVPQPMIEDADADPERIAESMKEPALLDLLEDSVSLDANVRYDAEVQLRSREKPQDMRLESTDESS